MTTAYKIMERTKRPTHFKTLFHGNYGKRSIPTGYLIEAQIREEAYDGSKSTTYRSGWHTLPSYSEARAYLSKFTRRLDKLCIVECEVSGEIWPKEHSPSNVLLSSKIVLVREVI